MIFLLISMSLLIQDPNVEVDEKRIKQIEAFTELRIESTKTQLKEEKQRQKAYKKGRVNPRQRGTTVTSRNSISFQSKAGKKETIARSVETIKNLESKLKRLKNKEEFSYGDLALPMKIGDFGSLQSERVNVVQVINKSSALIKIHHTVQDGSLEYHSATVMVKIDTSGMTDGSGFDLKQVFNVDDTTTYQTAQGSNTVFVISPLDTGPMVEFLKSKKKSSKN